MLVKFLENHDATSIAYKKFNQSPQDKYPTFSLCFQGNRFHWYHDLAIFNAFGLTSYPFQKMLEGNDALKYEYNLSTRLYRKTPTFMNNGSYISFDSFHLQMTDILTDLEFATENPEDMVYYGNNTKMQSLVGPPFHISYQSPDKICFTRNSNETTDLVRLHDDLSFNRTILRKWIYNETELQIFVHYPGQLMKSLNNPSFASSFIDYQWEKLLELKISQTTLLRKRYDSNNPCNNKIGDHDDYLQREIIKGIGCAPPYWNKNLSVDLGFEECNTPEQLNQLYDYIRNYNNYNSHDDPCLDMFNSVMYNWLKSNRDEVSIIQFIYRDKFYEEIQYARDFGFESFWSGIGGFAGLFMGFSIMQFPTLLGNITIIAMTLKAR